MDNFIMPGSYTDLEYRDATSGNMSLEDAVQHLKKDARIRSVREALARCMGMEAADRHALRKALVDLLMGSIPDAKRENIDRNVRNWLADGHRFINKSSAIQLAYALHLPAEKAEACMTRLCDEPLHWRNPEDIVWLYGLINKLDYAQAKVLMKRLKQEGFLNVPKRESSDTMTATIREKVEQLRTEAELTEYLTEAKGQLGKLHNTAYEMFKGFMNILQNPAAHTSKAVPTDKSMSVREVIATYMLNAYIPRACQGDELDNAVLSAIQRAIRANWPDESALSKMKHRESDVTRKVLMLLFLATDGGMDYWAEPDDADAMDAHDASADEVFEDMEARMNQMLADSGFAKLDPRSPFDWMVLYCMCMYAKEALKEELFVEDYMREFLKEIFKEPTPDVDE